MRHFSPRQGVVAALKADTLSLVCWQVGMYGFMAFAQLYLLRHLLGYRAEVDTPEFWFMMQIAMIVGFLNDLSNELVADQLRHQGKDVRVKQSAIEAAQAARVGMATAL